MSQDNLNKSYLYRRGEWIALSTRDDVLEEILQGSLNPYPTPEWYESLGYNPKPVVFKAPDGLAQVEVYTQSSDADRADYSFMCNVSIAGATHIVLVDDTPSLMGLINEMGPAIQYSLLSEQPGAV